MADDQYKKGFLVPALGRVADWLKRNLLMGWLARIWPILDQSAVAAEIYVLCWFTIAALAIIVALCPYVVAPLRGLVYILAGLRGLEIIVRAASVDITDVISPVRTLVLAVINYLELMLWFGLIYALNYQGLRDQSIGNSPPAGAITGYYFSITTQLTIGYGDVYATSWLRIVAALQGLAGALFVIVVLGRAVSAPPRR